MSHHKERKMGGGKPNCIHHFFGRYISICLAGAGIIQYDNFLIGEWNVMLPAGEEHQSRPLNLTEVTFANISVMINLLA